MKTKLLRLLSFLGLILAAIGAIDLNGLVAVLPPTTAGYFFAAGLVAAALKDAILIVGDFADDGQRNQSFKIQVLVLFLGMGCLLFLPSCVTSDATVTAPGHSRTQTKCTDPLVLRACVGEHVWGDGGGDGGGGVAPRAVTSTPTFYSPPVLLPARLRKLKWKDMDYACV